MKKFNNSYRFVYMLLASMAFSFVSTKSAYAQLSNDPLISLSLKNSTIEHAIKQLEKKYGLRFSYSSDRIPLQNKITVESSNRPLSEVLELIFKDTGIQFSQIENKIILIPPAKNRNARFTISGFIKESGSEELLPGVNISKPGYYIGVSSNNYGFYSLSLPADTHLIAFSFVGYQPVYKQVVLNGDLQMDIHLSSSMQLQTVEIKDLKIPDREKNISGDAIEVTAESINNTPRLLGEKDALATTRYISGVSRETDLSNGFNIRGGTPDQNLIILDDAPLYNAFHLFGMYSIFNTDALKYVQVTKSGFPARYGGRLSSIVEMVTKEGNKESLHGDLSIGLVSGHLSLEGPLKKNTSSFFISARRTFIGELAMTSSDSGGINYYFHDLNFKVNTDLGKKDRLYLSGYMGSDHFSGTDQTDSYGYSSHLNWGNKSGSVRWNHLFSNKIFSNTSLIASDYSLSCGQGDKDVRLSFSSGIRDLSIKHDLDYFISNTHHLKSGINFTYHRFNPGSSVAYDTSMTFVGNNTYHNIESAVYAEDEIRLGPKLGMNAGIRLSHFNYNKKDHFKPEPRILLTWTINSRNAIKASYTQMNQYVHLVSNQFGIGLPTDLWLPSTSRIKPESATQYGLTYFRTLSETIKISSELYYKESRHILNYKNNVSFISLLFNFDNPENVLFRWEDLVTEGKGWAYGWETQIEKRSDKLNVTLAYTLSYTEHQFAQLNEGQKFYASHDRRHNLSLLLWYPLSKRWKVSSSFIYATGTPFSLPASTYIIVGHEPGNVNPNWGFDHNSTILFASEETGKNIYRSEPYHRLDISASYTHPYSFGSGFLELGIMNVYNRYNPIYYTVSTDAETQNNVLKKLSFMGILPSLSYSIRF